jgi:HlyD family secretion protein
MCEDSATANMPRTESAPSIQTGHGVQTSHGAAARFAPMAAAGVFFVSAFFLSGCSAKPEGAEPAPTVAVQVGAAENEPIERKVIGDAILYPLDQAAIVPKIAAPVKKFYVERGSTVHAGQVLAELESADLAGAVTDSQGGYAQAQATYDAAVQKAKQDLELTKETLDSQQRLYDSRQALYKQGAASAKDVDDAKLSLSQAQAQYDTAQKQLDLKIAEGELSSAKGKTASAEAQLSYAKIVSPIDGVVTDRPVYPGEMPASGSPIITVMNLSEVVARTHISQQEAALLKVGDAATITAPGASAEIKGRVMLVSPALDPNSTTVEVWVRAANPKMELKPGASVRVRVVAQTVPHAIVIPTAALLTDSDGTTTVMTLDTDNKPHKQKVKVGIKNADEIQITAGLKGGERVVTVGAFQLASEDDDLLAKTSIQVQAPPNIPDEDEDDDTN